MDEDDGIAILTRRLITEHEFFKWTVEKPSEYSIVKTTKGKNLKVSDPYFTQIEVFYKMNLAFLSSSSRTAHGWWLSKRETVPHNRFKFWQLSRPEEDILDDYFKELSDIWDGILRTMPELRNPPTQMRVHNPSDEEEEAATEDHVVFWPIGQEPFSQIIRELLDEYCTRSSKDILDKAEVVEALKPLNRIQWSLHRKPWRHLLLVQSRDKAGNLTWTMRNEERTQAIRIAKEVLEFLLGITPLDDQGQAELQRGWANSLVPIPSEADGLEMWHQLVKEALSVQDT